MNQNLKQQKPDRQEQEEPENQEVKRISFSEFKNWKECPWRHKLIYLDKLPYFSANEYTAFGTAMHAACEEIMKSSDKEPLSVFNLSFLSQLTEIKSSGKILDSSLVRDMKEQASFLCKEILPAVKSHFKEFKVISIEELLLEPISEFDSYETNFKGFIDLVLRTEDGKYHIIDWKTCSWGWSTAKKADPTVNYQLTYYKNYFSKKHNINPADIETYFILLKRTAKKEKVEVLRVTSGPRKVKNSLKVLQNAVINIERKNHIKNRLSCKYCKFHNTEYCT